VITLPNVQPIEKSEPHPEGLLDVHSVFYTVQGEGPFAGRPAVFIRLAGCNLQCPLCDTDYTSGRRLLSKFQLIIEVLQQLRGPYQTNHPDRDLIVITGGEPLRQRLGDFIGTALANFVVQIETNGTLYDPSLSTLYDHPKLHFVCSPKTPKVAPEIVRRVDAWKYVISAGQVEADGLPSVTLNGCRPFRPLPLHQYHDKVYVQPCDEQDPVKNAANTKAAVDSCLRFGYTLCLQLHKIVGLE